MFGLLKNKLASFIKGLSGKEEQKTAPAVATDGAQLPSAAKATQAPAVAPEEPSSNSAAVVEEKKIAEIKTESKIEKKETPKPENKEEMKHKHVEAKPVPKTEPAPVDIKHVHKPVEEKPVEIKHGEKPAQKHVHVEKKSVEKPLAKHAEIKQVEATPVATPETARAKIKSTHALETKPVVVPDTKPVFVPETKPVVVLETKLAAKPETKPAVVPETKPAAKPETKPAVVPETKPAAKPETKPAVVPETKPAAKPSANLETKQIEIIPVAVTQPQAEAPKKEAPRKSIIDVLFNRKPEQPKPVEAKKQPSSPPAVTIPQTKTAVHPELKTEEKIAPTPAAQPTPKPVEVQKPVTLPQKIPVLPSDIPHQVERDLSHLERKASSASEKKDIAPKIGIATTLKSIFSNEITIGEAEVSDLLSELELSLLEADVAYDVSLDVSSQLRTKLVGMKVPKGKVEEKTREAIQDVLTSVMTSDRKFDMVSRVRSLEKPAKILFVGPNGAGKTTTMAKVAHMLLQGGMTVVFSASDTFRAAAIEQTEVHAGRLGVKVVKSKYGADPASVAFEAVSFARAHSIDVVLIDSAGRQDTNANLLDELKKISRVAKPDIKIYIGESIGGNSLIDQVRAFDEAIGMDGAILTKIDCDAKGGTALSLTKSTGIPVLYLGVGQAYADLIPFEPEKIAHEIMS